MIIKPDAVKNKVVGKIISIIEDNNIDIIKIKKIILNRKNVEIFYFEHKSKPFYGELIDFMLSVQL
ncbi:MAG TPA: nucleoside-diphosphate kinase [Candidatus Azoamicus sp.]